MRGRHALKQFVRKGGMSFSLISHTRCLSGSVIFCVFKKKFWINFQCRRKNVIMVVYGKSDCYPCPYVNTPTLKINFQQLNLEQQHALKVTLISSYFV